MLRIGAAVTTLTQSFIEKDSRRSGYVEGFSLSDHGDVEGLRRL